MTAEVTHQEQFRQTGMWQVLGSKMAGLGKDCKHTQSTCDRPGTVLDIEEKTAAKQTKYTPLQQAVSSVIECVLSKGKTLD